MRNEAITYTNVSLPKSNFGKDRYVALEGPVSDADSSSLFAFNFSIAVGIS
jgi:hypothetical protein